MADMANARDVPKIKLFGTTIALKERHVSEGTNKDGDEEQKRPEKIIPCPRCKSMETKFCYFNNYNVNQPRHFCKGCQRYWTAGGAQRNVPVGAGRRKAKALCQGDDVLYQESCVFDVSSELHDQIAFDGVVGEWRILTQGGYLHCSNDAKRPRNSPGGQMC